jgi:hypothetical protein
MVAPDVVAADRIVRLIAGYAKGGSAISASPILIV